MERLRLGKHKIRIPAVCGAVIGKNLNEVRTGITSAVKQGADLVELRMDGLQNTEGWEELPLEDVPIILTNRPNREGGSFKGEERKRVELLAKGIQRGVACVDIELSTPKKLRDSLVADAKDSGVTVLMSHHDFSTTPSTETLMRTVGNLVETKCDIAKLVTFAESPDHALRMLDFIIRARDTTDTPIIAFAMGEAGNITRLVSPIFGSPWIYAGVREKTAPNQPDMVIAKKWIHELATLEVRG